MVISRSPAASQAVSGLVCFGGKCLPYEEHIKVLGLAVDSCLRFDHHAATVARQTSKRISAPCRMACNLDSHGILILYKAQIWPCMEYDGLKWMSNAATHLRRLDAMQRRALRLVDSDGHQHPTHTTSLEYRRDVSVLAVFHKIQVQEVPHLSWLRLLHPPPRGEADLHSQATSL